MPGSIDRTRPGSAGPWSRGAGANPAAARFAGMSVAAVMLRVGLISGVAFSLGNVGGLLLILMLARIDGKSPVEYLDDENCGIVRSLAIPLIKKPVHSLIEMVERISLELENHTL